MNAFFDKWESNTRTIPPISSFPIDLEQALVPEHGAAALAALLTLRGVHEASNAFREIVLFRVL